MRESRTYGSGRGACHEMHVPTAKTSPPRIVCIWPRALPRSARLTYGYRAAHPSRPVRIVVVFPSGRRRQHCRSLANGTMVVARASWPAI